MGAVVQTDGRTYGVCLMIFLVGAVFLAWRGRSVNEYEALAK
jgi:hypothetical protein